MREMRQRRSNLSLIFSLTSFFTLSLVTNHSLLNRLVRQHSLGLPSGQIIQMQLLHLIVKNLSDSWTTEIRLDGRIKMMFGGVSMSFNEKLERGERMMTTGGMV